MEAARDGVEGCGGSVEEGGGDGAALGADVGFVVSGGDEVGEYGGGVYVDGGGIGGEDEGGGFGGVG